MGQRTSIFTRCLRRAVALVTLSLGIMIVAGSAAQPLYAGGPESFDVSLAGPSTLAVGETGNFVVTAQSQFDEPATMVLTIITPVGIQATGQIDSESGVVCAVVPKIIEISSGAIRCVSPAISPGAKTSVRFSARATASPNPTANFSLSGDSVPMTVLSSGTKAFPVTIGTGSAGAKPVSMPELKRNAKGEAVRTLQTLLNQHGADLLVDGDFGPETERAVKAFQEDQEITVDGIVGPETWGKLLEE